MRVGLVGYWDSLINDIPHELYAIALITFLAAITMFVGLKGIKEGLRYSVGVLLIEYIILIYCSTVFLRTTNKLVTFDFMPFWSYLAFFEGREPNALIENFANVLVFIPVGLLATIAIKKASMITVGIIGTSTSIGIELLQLVFKKGFSEIDDVMHNTLGCVIGYGLFSLIRLKIKYNGH